MNYLTTEDGKAIKETNPLDVKDSTIGTLIGEATSSPTANTLLARMKSLEDKIDGITGGSTPAVTQLSGSNMELYGATVDTRPAANAVPVGATYTIVDDTQNFDSFISNGVKWLEV